MGRRACRRGAVPLRQHPLEAFSSDLALAQAAELLANAPAKDRTTIFVCDCNSDPLNGSIKTNIGDTQRHWAAYRLITGAGGFTDEWLEWAPANQGWTSGLSELVNDATAVKFDHRIDMVFAKRADGDGLAVDRARSRAPRSRRRTRRPVCGPRTTAAWCCACGASSECLPGLTWNAF